MHQALHFADSYVSPIIGLSRPHLAGSQGARSYRHGVGWVIPGGGYFPFPSPGTRLESLPTPPLAFGVARRRVLGLLWPVFSEPAASAQYQKWV